jgi:hypothetical protein
MNSRLVASLALGFVALTAASLPAQRRGEEQPARHGWLFSLAEGKAQARKSGKPLMVVLRCVP